VSNRKPQYHPAKPDGVQLTIQQFAEFADVIQKLIRGSPLKWAIIAAGVGAIAELLHILWLALRYILHF
jgi:hypothetical protein